jgi:hypothetical protein
MIFLRWASLIRQRVLFWRSERRVSWIGGVKKRSGRSSWEVRSSISWRHEMSESLSLRVRVYLGIFKLYFHWLPVIWS